MSPTVNYYNVQVKDQNINTNNYNFLQGGGEMGELTRQYNWSQTPLGAPEYWPQSLRTTVAILLSSRFPMFLWWGEDLIQFYNDAYRPSLGKDGKHPIALGQKGKNCWPEIWDIIYPLIQQVLTTGEATWSEDQLIPIYRNGMMEDVYWTFGYSPVRGETGHIAGVLVICNETTEKVKNVTKLIESQQRFESLVHDASVGIIVLTGERFIVEIVNDAYGRLISRSYNELIGKALFDIIPETEIYFRSIIDSVRHSGVPVFLNDHPYFVYVDGIRRDGFLNLVYQPYKEGDGIIKGVMVLCQDVTEQVLTRNKLVQSEKNLRNTILKAPVAMCIFKGPEHLVEIANEKMIELWGKTAADVINKPIFEGVPEIKDQGFESLLAQVYTTGEACSDRGIAIHLPRGSKIETVYVNFVYQAYREADGSISGVIAVATDVTDQVLARQKIEEVVAHRTKELADANNSLQKSNAELAQFAYIASHDLQEPIRKVSTFAQMLESSLGNIDDRSHSYLSRINKSTDRMLTLVRDVLAFSQLSKDSQVFEQVNLQQIIENIISDFDLLIDQKKAQIKYNDLPVLEAIPLQMSQLFGNLVSNALKFSRQDTPPVISITATLLAQEEVAQNISLDENRLYYNIEVKDNGIGFKQSHAEQIFSIFQRLHGKTEYEGTGIGLAMCKKIVQNHQGDIYAFGDTGVGAVFKVVLPGKWSVDGGDVAFT